MLKAAGKKRNGPGRRRGQSCVPPPAEGRGNTKHRGKPCIGGMRLSRAGSGGCDGIERGACPSRAALSQGSPCGSKGSSGGFQNLPAAQRNLPVVSRTFPRAKRIFPRFPEFSRGSKNLPVVLRIFPAAQRFFLWLPESSSGSKALPAVPRIFRRPKRISPWFPESSASQKNPPARLGGSLYYGWKAAGLTQCRRKYSSILPKRSSRVLPSVRALRAFWNTIQAVRASLWRPQLLMIE